MQRKFNGMAMLAGVLVWLVVRTGGPKIGLPWIISGLGGALLGVMVYFLIDDYLRIRK